MRIDFLVAKNTYKATESFSKAFAEALQRADVETRLHKVEEGDFFSTLQSDPPDFTCSFSDIHCNGMPIGELWRIPHISLLVDPAIYFLHQMRGAFSGITCVDEGDVEFVRKLGFERVSFLPHAGDQSHLTSPAKDRPYDVVFFGSCIEFETDDERVIAASKRVLSPEGPSILEALVELGVPDEELPRYHNEVDLFTRSKDRIELLRSLRGHNLHIWGNGPWEKYAPHATIHKPISFDQTLEVMKEAKVVVNSSPRFKKGLHERIVYGALCGAAVLSGQGGSYNYRYGEWESFNFSDWQHQAEKSQQEMLLHHTWDHRAALLRKILETQFN